MKEEEIEVGVLPEYPPLEDVQVVMGYSNAVAFSDGIINCTVHHSEFGDIPFSYIEGDDTPTARQLKKLLDADGVKWGKLKKCPTIRVRTESLARVWRNDELSRADVIINKIEDFEIEGDSKAWRQYRVALRNWPDAKGFPTEKSKPKAPDAV